MWACEANEMDRVDSGAFIDATSIWESEQEVTTVRQPLCCVCLGAAAVGWVQHTVDLRQRPQNQGNGWKEAGMLGRAQLDFLWWLIGLSNTKRDYDTNCFYRNYVKQSSVLLYRDSSDCLTSNSTHSSRVTFYLYIPYEYPNKFPFED